MTTITLTVHTPPTPAQHETLKEALKATLAAQGVTAEIDNEAPGTTTGARSVRRVLDRDDPWTRPFVITTVCRADLKAFFSEAEIARLDDDDMEAIAEKMADAYCEEVFWIDLEILAQDVLDAKAVAEASMHEQAGR